jgi:ribosome-binding protein aMBF1 (putative translation factor)
MSFGNAIATARQNLGLSIQQLLEANPDLLYGLENRAQTLKDLEQNRLHADEVPNAIIEAAHALGLDTALLSRLAYNHKATDWACQFEIIELDEDLRPIPADDEIYW